MLLAGSMLRHRSISKCVRCIKQRCMRFRITSKVLKLWLHVCCFWGSEEIFVVEACSSS